MAFYCKELNQIKDECEDHNIFAGWFNNYLLHLSLLGSMIFVYFALLTEPWQFAGDDRTKEATHFHIYLTYKDLKAPTLPSM